jgi:UDP-glucose 4-epimerase
MTASGERRAAVVTGAAGFLGGHMVERLLAEGYRVRAIDLDGARFARSLGAVADDPNLTFDDRGILDIPAGDPIFGGLDALFHFAGRIDPVSSMQDPEGFMQANVLALARVLEGLRQAGKGKIVYASTAAIYGRQTGAIKETAAPQPVNPYGFTKLLGEQAICHWARVFSVPGLVFRLFAVYGPRSEFGSTVNTMIERKFAGLPLVITGDGNQVRDFLHVSDVIAAMLLGAETELPGTAYNLGAGRPTSMNELAAAVGGRIEYLPARPNEIMAVHADTAAIRADSAWAPAMSLADGIADTVAHYRTLDAAALGRETLAG